MRLDQMHERNPSGKLTCDGEAKMSSGCLRTAKRATVALVLALSLLWPAAAATQNVWTSHGPEGGTITAIAVDPQKPTTLYAGTLVGGALKSIDGGESWQPVNNGLADLTIRRGSPASPRSPTIDHSALERLHVVALAIDPLTPTTVYASTASGDVFRSTNGGGNWSALNAGRTIRYAHSLIVDPRTPTTLYMSGPPVDWQPGQPGLPPWTGGGVLKSTDEGKSWHAVNTGLPTTMVRGETIPLIPSLAIDPQTPSTLYAATEAGLFMTTDGGNNWRAVLKQPAIAGLRLTTVVIDPQTSTTIYVGSARSLPGSSGGVFKSIDGGDHWIVASNSGLSIPDIQILAIDPRSPATLFAAVASTLPSDGYLSPTTGGGFTPGGLFKSTDGGRTWRSITTGLPNGVVHALAIDPQGSNTVYAGPSANGVYKTTNGGESWRAVNIGLTGLDLYSSALAIDPKAPTTVYVTTVGGIFKSTESGDLWQPVDISSFNTNRVGTLAIASDAPTTIYVGTTGFGVFKSSNGGNSWRSINNGLKDFTTSGVSALVVDPRTPTTLYLCLVGDPYGVPSGVYKTTDAGDNWVAVNNGLPERRIVFSLAIAPSAPTILYLSLRYAGTGDAGVYKTTDGGTTWHRVGQSSNIGDVLAVDPLTPDIVYAGGVRDREGFGVFKTVDGGRTWRPINAGLTNLHVRALAIDPQTPTTIYLGTEEWPGGTRGGGVFKSTDGGNTWGVISTGLTDLTVNALAIDPKAPSTIYAATTRDGVFILRQ
jgi:photosystem II stability/assembly factor-like uncharacterized protein